MRRATVVEARLFDIWGAYQNALVRSIAPLSDAQLALQVAPGQRTVGEIAEHIVFGRALWFTRAPGGAVAELEPILQWDDPDDPPRSAAEVVQGLELTWQLYSERMMRGTADDEQSADDQLALEILWGMFDHELFHAGELSIVLGCLGLPGVELED